LHRAKANPLTGVAPVIIAQPHMAQRSGKSRAAPDCPDEA
jgi:hypothetical protein